VEAGLWCRGAGAWRMLSEQYCVCELELELAARAHAIEAWLEVFGKCRRNVAGEKNDDEGFRAGDGRARRV
jgi:hypothetical protein